jgi:large-conductance mechanosensitive channel
MKTPPTHDEDNETRAIYRTGFGDIGIVLIAAFCTLAFILMMVLPSPIAKYEKAKAQHEKDEAQTAQAARQQEIKQEINKAVATGEVSVGIAAKKP